MVKVFSKISLLFVLLILLSFQISISQTQTQSLKVQGVREGHSRFNTPKISSDYGKIPLYFIRNEGQVSEKALFYAKASRYTLWITKEGLVFDSTRKIEEKGRKNQIMNIRDGMHPEDSKYDREVSKLQFLNPSKNIEIVPVDVTERRVNYFLGKDRSKWRTNIQTSRGVLYKELYKNIDLKVYGVEKQIEYDFVVKPGGQISEISFEYQDVAKTKIDRMGNLIVETKFGELMHAKPVCYQIIGRERIEVEAQFREIRNNIYGFKPEEYNKNYELIIDPLVFVYSTYLGGSWYDVGRGIAVDSEGAAYVAGYTLSTDFPTQNPIQGSNAGGRDVFITKINSSGTAVLYSTYLGGSDTDYGFGVAVDSEGAAYVTGETDSLDFPTHNPIQGNNAGGRDVFITKINSSGTAVLYSSYLGGSDNDCGYGLAVDSDDATYVTGETKSTDFPTHNPIQGSNAGGRDAFITKVNPTGTALVYSTYLGGPDVEWGMGDYGYSIAVDSEGAAYVTGETSSLDFPLQNPIEDSYAANGDAFITKINSVGSALVYSTYLGGYEYWDCGYGIAVDSEGAAYVTGTFEEGDFPWGHPKGVFIIKINSSGNALVYSTYLGGMYCMDRGKGIRVDSKGAAIVIGSTCSNYFSERNLIQENDEIDHDVLILKINPRGRETDYSTYFHGSEDDSGSGIAVDSAGVVYITGLTGSSDFPTQNPIQENNAGDADAFIAKFCFFTYSLTITAGVGGTTDPEPGTYDYCAGTKVTVEAIPDEGYGFSEWTGDVPSGKKRNNPITITVDSDKSIKANFIRIIYPPLNFSGQKVLNRSLSQAEYINVLTWEANPNNVNIVKYRIYQVEGESQSLLVELNADTFQYWHRGVEKDRQYAYILVAVNDEGREGNPAYLTVQ